MTYWHIYLGGRKNIISSQIERKIGRGTCAIVIEMQAVLYGNLLPPMLGITYVIVTIHL
jgi:hypothetical protein